MHLILLSGGSGKRLWPLSNEIRSKQFIKIFRRPDAGVPGEAGSGAYESMVQRVYRQITAVDPDADITIATSRSQVSAIHNQLGEGVEVSVEPCRRDTFPAIALAAAFLRDCRGVDPEEAVVVCPVDPYADDAYFRSLLRMWELARGGEADLVLMGIDPTYPSEKYGYILPEDGGAVTRVRSFREKPDAAAAQAYIEAGGLWNGGVFACRLRYILQRAKEIAGCDTHAELLERYASLKPVSFDYAVVEHEKNTAVLRFAGEWKDLGTWNTLTEAMVENTVGDVRLDPACENVHAINELGVPILAMGLRDVVISASPEGILVSDKEQSSYIKPFVDAMDRQVMFAEKSWGSFRVLDVGRDSLTIKVTLNPGHRMNYHSHDRRDEVWTVIGGSGKTVVDGIVETVGPGDVITMAAGCRHTVIADTELRLIEVQLGRDISVSDKHKYPLDV